MSKPARERLEVGMSLTVDDGVERSRRRGTTGPNKGNWYEETVLNPDGSVYHHQTHQVRDHIGHGSAKRRPR